MIQRFFFLSIIFSLFQFPSLASGDTLIVCPTCPISQITGAIQLANPFDIIEVRKGVYTEGNIIIDKPVTLIGKDYPIVDGENDAEIITINSDSVIISGFQIQNVGVNYIKDRAGIHVNRRNFCVIENNRLLNTFFGVYLENAEDCLVRNNQIIGDAIVEFSSGNAIHAWYCKRILVEGNTVKNHRDGIYLEFCDDSQIKNNISEDNVRYGLHFMFSNRDQYLGNQFRNNGAGVAVMFSHEIIMNDNTFEKNWGASSYGLLLKEIYDGEIKGNDFIENTIGIYGEGANRIQISENNFMRNGWALNIWGSCFDNVFTRNNFIGNTFDLSTNTSRNNNDYTGNYWSDYSGYDLNRDGIGDIPHRPLKLFSYLANRVEPSIILLHSLFIDLINFAEKITPVFTPPTLIDSQPRIKPVP